ncbi:MAG: energy-coupling factor transporter transmembrane protein EcfT [Bacillales bacterium]|jgi:energy-coupling factor transport system permease protein|nr:energy-coupling factor transporter transmembrane protein EcfT [Bacillales bacterium]
MNNALGRYIDKDTLVHKIDPRIKLISIIVLTVCLFLPNIEFVGLGFIGFFVLLLVIFGKIPLTYIFKPLKFVWIMVVFLFIVDMLTTKTGTVWFTLWGIKFYQEVFLSILYILLRVTMMITISMILTATTKPLHLNYALEYLMTPLKLVKFPVVEVSMMISIALRFIPTISLETQRLMKAQSSRGANFQSPNIFKRVGALVSLLVPLFISAFDRSEQLADAMEVKGFDIEVKRSKYQQLKFSLKDLFFLIFILLILFGTILISIYYENIITFIFSWF